MADCVFVLLRIINRAIPALVSALSLAGFVASAQEVLYANDLEKNEPGPLPEEFQILSGDFEIRQEDGNKVIELPGAPLESFWLMFGPPEQTNVVATARIKGTSQGRRMPAFGIGVGGLGGFRLQVAPARRAIEIWRGEAMVATVPYRWHSGEWSMLKLQVVAGEDGVWKVEGKVWPQGSTEPADWTLAFEDKKEPNPGRALITGTPYSGTAIQFDDLKVVRVEPSFDKIGSSPK